jgi:DNA-nicking Smr family endonuclease
MTVKREKDRLVVDVHGMRVADAQFRLETLLASCGADVRTICVIHGCNNGQALRDMARALTSPRLARVRPDYFNDGQTILELKVKK